MIINVKLYQRVNQRTGLQIRTEFLTYITKNIYSNYIQIKDNLELGSDHSPILLTLSESIIQKPCNSMLVNKNTDWESFRKTLEDRIQLIVPLHKEEHLDLEVEKFVTDIQQSAWENTSEIKRTLKGTNHPK
jgi:hypothetical protein